MIFDVELLENDMEFPVEMEDPETEPVETENPVVEVVSSDHSKLQNRDAPDQHPISAITDLEKSLAAYTTPDDVKQAIDNSTKELSNQDILRIWNNI